MTYTEVLNNNWHKLLPEKKKYTKRDMDDVLIKSLLNNKINGGKTFTYNQARFITICTAIFYNVPYSKSLEEVI